MIEEMAETMSGIQNEYQREFEDIIKEYAGKPFDGNDLYCLERYMEYVAQKLSAEHGVHIIPGKVRADIDGNPMMEEPKIEMEDGSIRRLSQWWLGI